MVHAAVELRHPVQLDHLAVHPRADEARLPGLLEQLAELALPAAHQRREQLDLRALGPREDDVGDLAGRLPLDRRAVVGAVRHAGAGVEQPQVVVDLGDGADGGARVLAGALLLDRDRRGEPLDHVHVRLLHQAEELAGVGGERLDVAPLALGVDGVEGEGGLPRAGEPGDDGQAVARDLDVDVLEIVLAGTADDEPVVGHSPLRYLNGGLVSRLYRLTTLLIQASPW